MKASNCDVCVNFLYDKRDLKVQLLDTPKCRKGHKPRFYKPHEHNPYLVDWGYKRICADFTAK